MYCGRKRLGHVVKEKYRGAVDDYDATQSGLEARIAACNQNCADIDVYENDNPTEIPWRWVEEEKEELRLALSHMLAFDGGFSRPLFIERADDHLKQMDSFKGTFERSPANTGVQHTRQMRLTLRPS